MKGVDNNGQKVISCFLHVSDNGWNMFCWWYCNSIKLKGRLNWTDSKESYPC